MLGIVLDMDTPTSSHQAGSCFISTEKGTYFDGTEYVKAGIVLSFECQNVTIGRTPGRSNITIRSWGFPDQAIVT